MIAALRAFAIAGVVLAGWPSPFQTPARDASPSAFGTSGLSGVVVDDLTSRPLRRAVVTVSGATSGVRLTAITDDTGTFSFTDLPADRYQVSAGKPGFVSLSYGAKKPGRPGIAIALDAGQQKKDLTLRLQPGGVLTGVVRDATGEPLPGARVVVLRMTYGFDTGERTLSSVAGGFGEPTDDRGVYRVYGLPPDDYFVVVTTSTLVRSASEMRETTTAEVDWATRLIRGQSSAMMAAPGPPPEPGPSLDYAPVFYPGGYTQAQATAISLKEGEERSGVDVLLGWTRTAKILGTVVSPDGPVPQNLQVNVIAHDPIPGIPFSGFGSARVAPDGSFVSPGLPPGDYTVTVRVGAGAGARGAAPPANAAALFGIAIVTVSGADVTTTLPLQKGVTVSGKLIFDGDASKPPADALAQRVSLNPVRSRIPTLGVGAATVDTTAGTFTFTGVTPGRYRISSFLGGGWQFRSAMVQGHDAADFPLEIGSDDIRDVEVRFSDKSTEVSGDLLDADGHPASEYSIIVFAADKAYWMPQSRRIQSARPSGDGHFRVQNLPPGDYYIGAVTDVEPGEWYDPSFLTELQAAARKFTLSEGEKTVQNLKIAR